MRFGKIRIDEHELKYNRMMKTYVIPCRDIKWAYRRVEDSSARMCCGVYSFSTNYIRIMTNTKKVYQFEMPEDEAKACLIYLKERNPKLIVGFPKGAPLSLNSVFNTRDLGGLKAGENKVILPYQLIRSGDLYHLSAEDVKKLKEEYRLHTVIDFRTELERNQKPDTVIEGVNYVKIPVLMEETLGISREKNPMELFQELGENPEAYMMSMYQKLVLSEESQKQYAEFFRILLDMPEDCSVLWHCTAGKDRAGVAAMLLLFALGVARGAVLDDYMRTNICLHEELEYLEHLMEAKGVSQEKIEHVKVVLSARESYLQTAMNTIKSEYGSMERYLGRALGLTPSAIKKLKERYLV